MANTGNPETDKLGIAEIEPVKGFLLGKTITAKAGISQEIFHNGAYYGSVLLAQASINLTTAKQALKMEARNGDVVISVHLGSYPLIWDGELFTKDGYVQKYHAELQSHVVEPWLFATYCLWRSDPVRM